MPDGFIPSLSAFVDSSKRTIQQRLADLLSNPGAVGQQIGGQLNDQAGPFNDTNTAAALGSPDAKNAMLASMLNLATNGIGAGVIKSVRAPKWNETRKFLPVGIDPTRDEIIQLLRDKQSISSWNTLRTIKDAESGKLYAWPADAALHNDIGAHFSLNPQATKHGLITP